MSACQLRIAFHVGETHQIIDNGILLRLRHFQSFISCRLELDLSRIAECDGSKLVCLAVADTNRGMTPIIAGTRRNRRLDLLYRLRVGHVNRRPQHGLSINYQLQEMVATVQVVSIRCLPEEIRFEVPVERLRDGSKVFGECVSMHHSTVY